VGEARDEEGGAQEAEAALEQAAAAHAGFQDVGKAGAGAKVVAGIVSALEFALGHGEFVVHAELLCSVKPRNLERLGYAFMLPGGRGSKWSRRAGAVGLNPSGRICPDGDIVRAAVAPP